MDMMRRAVAGVLVLVIIGGSPAVSSGQGAPSSMIPVIDDQVILPGEQFTPVVLAGVGAGDGEEPLMWQISGNNDLRVDLTQGVVTVSPPDDEWRGSETLRFEACTAGGVCAAQDAMFWLMDDLREPLTLTYVSNSGFLIEAGETKILVDALFAEHEFPPPDVLAMMVGFQPPFDAVDLVLVTHNRPDHFSAEIVTRYLRAHPDTVLVADALSARRVSARVPQVTEIALTPGAHRQMVVNGVGVECLYIVTSEDDLPNIGYLITVGGWRLFHPGDIVDVDATLAVLRDYRLLDRHIDIAFVPYAYLIDPDIHTLIVEGIGAEVVVAGQYGSISPAALSELIGTLFPGAVTFNSELDTWTPPEPEDDEE